MNFWEKCKRPWTAPPPPHFRKILLQFLQDRIIILYLGVRLATVGADVSLNMFRIAMLGDVLQKGGLVREALVAGVALVRLVALVAPRVGLQVGQLGERLRTTWRQKDWSSAGKIRWVQRFLPEVQSIDRTDRHSVRA